MKLFSDVNLEKICISPDGRGIILSFIDMFRGEPLSNIKCDAVYVFNYQNSFSDTDNLACYVGEVDCFKIEKEKISAWLSEKKFKFADIQWLNYLKLSNDLIHLHLEGGEIIIDLLCEKIKKNDVELKYIDG